MAKIDDLKSSLKSEMNQYQMLNNTLLEMFSRDSSEGAIKAVKQAMDETTENIKGLQTLIADEIEKENNKKPIYSFYDNVKKETTAKKIEMKPNLYDSIKKRGMEDFIPYDTPYNKLNYEEEYKKNSDNKLQVNDGTNVIRSNMFLVRFGDALNIQEWFVKGVNIHPFNNEVEVYVNNHIAEKKGRKYPILSEVFAQKNTFPLSIDYLDPTGVVLYTERYHGCRIIEVNRGGLDYTYDDINSFGIRMTYSEITYETAH